VLKLSNGRPESSSISAVSPDAVAFLLPGVEDSAPVLLLLGVMAAPSCACFSTGDSALLLCLAAGLRKASSENRRFAGERIGSTLGMGEVGSALGLMGGS
jgi:hypothetical protein